MQDVNPSSSSNEPCGCNSGNPKHTDHNRCSHTGKLTKYLFVVYIIQAIVSVVLLGILGLSLLDSRKETMRVPSIVAVRYMPFEIAAETLRLPWTWVFNRANENGETQLAFQLNEIDTVYPANQSIMVRVTGKERIMNHETLAETTISVLLRFQFIVEDGSISLQFPTIQSVSFLEPNDGFPQDRLQTHFKQIETELADHLGDITISAPKGATGIHTIDRTYIYFTVENL